MEEGHTYLPSTPRRPPPRRARAKRKPIYRSLFFQVFVAIAAGISVGHFFPDLGSDLRPLGDGFIKMIIAPLIFCVVVTGIAHVGDVKSVGRIGLKALIYFELVTTFALVFGLVIANVLKPGKGFDIDPSTLAGGEQALAEKTGGSELPHTVEFLMGIIPDSVVGAFAENQLLAVLFFSVLFGIGLAQVNDTGKGSAILELIDQFTHVLFTIVGYVMKVAPIGAFGAMAFIIGQYGIGSLASFGKLIGACYLAAVLFALVLAAIAKLYVGLNLFGADRIMDSMRAFVNLLGNCVATFVVSKWEGQLDIERMHAVMNGEIDVDDDVPDPDDLHVEGHHPHHHEAAPVVVGTR